MATKQPRMAKPINPQQRPAPKMAEVEAVPSMTPTPSMLSAASLDQQATLPIADEQQPEPAAPAAVAEVAEVPAVEQVAVPIEAESTWEEPAAAEPVAAEPVAAPVEPVAAATFYPQTMREMFVRVDSGWAYFRAAAGAFPSERMDERLDDGWTRKQMLAHIGAWHDQTHDRLGALILTGRPSETNVDTDSFNARVARQAIGRTAGEVLKEMEMTFNRLRRQLAGLSDEQLVAFDGWAAQAHRR